MHTLLYFNSRITYRVPAIYRISYIWYSFLGAILTILLGLIISFITDRISASQILHLTNSNQNHLNDGNEKSEHKQHEFNKNSPAIFIVEKYRKKSQVANQSLSGIDNMGLKIEEV